MTIKTFHEFVMQRYIPVSFNESLKYSISVLTLKEISFMKILRT